MEQHCDTAGMKAKEKRTPPRACLRCAADTEGARGESLQGVMASVGETVSGLALSLGLLWTSTGSSSCGHLGCRSV